jgi:Fic family protein
MTLTNRQSELVLAVLTGSTTLSKLGMLQVFHEVTSRTLQRDLSELIEKEVLLRQGKGRSVTYTTSPASRLQLIYPEGLLEKVLADEKRESVAYDFDRLNLLEKNPLFLESEALKLKAYHDTFLTKLKSAPADIIRRERERITIELSWKSSQFEGNTYSLLETESLIKEGVAAKGKSVFETRMVLNHKKALDFSAENRDLFASNIAEQTIIELHKILIDGLDVGFGLRERRVAITGTAYIPLDNKFKIQEELKRFCNVLNSKQSIFEKALLAFFYVSYLQPFNDGNKRTGRILANAILYAHDSFPLSLRAIDVNSYKLAMLAFYEFGTLGNLKEAFIKQAQFAAENYTI